MKALTLPAPVLGVLRELGVLEDELLGVVNEAESKDPAFQDGGEAIKKFLVEKIAGHVTLEAAEALAASIAAQIIGKKPGYDGDHVMDA